MRVAILKNREFRTKIAFGAKKRNAFARANIPNKKKLSSWKNFFRISASKMFMIRRRLYAMNINPTSALALSLPFFVMM